MTLIHLGEQLFNSETIAVVRSVSDDACVIFTTGQSALDAGFYIELPIEEVEEELSKVDRNVLLDLADRLHSELSESGKNGNGKKSQRADTEDEMADHPRRRQ